VDKTQFIEHFLNDASQVILIARHRRLGKSLNMDTLRCFLTDLKDCRKLFQGLYIENSSVWELAHSAPVFYFSFKNMDAKDYKYKLFKQVIMCFDAYLDKNDLSEIDRFMWARYFASEGGDPDGLLLLTEMVYHVTGKKSYILIDEYDKLLRDTFQSDEYEEIFDYVKLFFSAGLKDNPYLEKGLLTGVLRVSYEGMLSDLNNVTTYDMFSDELYTDDYGLTEEEINEVHEIRPFDRDKAKRWYNGVKVSQKAIYNIFSVSSFLRSRKFDCYWGKSQLLSVIVDLMDENRRNALMETLNGAKIEVPVETRVSLKQLWERRDDYSFYSFLIQGGYLSLDEMIPETSLAKVSIPNMELVKVWKTFILSFLYPNQRKMLTMLDHTGNLSLLARDIEDYISDSLSFYDLSVYKGEGRRRVWERVYHIFILGVLSAYSESRYVKPVSEGESGDGRYDILYQNGDVNYLFEFKACDDVKELDARAEDALRQIDARRYGARLDHGRRLIKVGIAIYGKQCRVKCGG
jgi:hypothetical protein